MGNHREKKREHDMDIQIHCMAIFGLGLGHAKPKIELCR